MSCGTSSANAPASVDTGVASGDTTPAEDVASEEPPASCGTNVGDVLCDLPLEGYVRDGVATGLATAAPYVSAKLSEIVAQGTQKYAFIWTSSYW
jgi:hypothetical protein